MDEKTTTEGAGGTEGVDDISFDTSGIEEKYPSNVELDEAEQADPVQAQIDSTSDPELMAKTDPEEGTEEADLRAEEADKQSERMTEAAAEARAQEMADAADDADRARD